MTESIVDLWATGIANNPLRTPVAILREQAALLGPKTGNQIVAEVRSTHDEYSNFEHAFYLVVPVLENYRFRLLTVSHDIRLYPVTISDQATRSETSARDEAEFIAKLKLVLSSDQTRQAIRSLLGQLAR